MTKSRIIVTGLIGSIPLAGLTLHYLQYVLGLKQLGHDVLYLEDAGTWYYDPIADSMHDDADRVIAFLNEIMSQHGLGECWTFVDHHGNRSGVTGQALEEFIRSADLLINVTGAGIIRDEYLAIPRRAYVDTDPGFVQFRLMQGNSKDLKHLQRHNRFFSFGCNIGNARCRIPTAGFDWRATVQPIVMSLWPVAAAPADRAPFTTITKWKTYDPVEFEGELFGLKNDEFPPYQELPRMTDARLEIAGAGNPPVRDLEEIGWTLANGPGISSGIDTYQDYIRRSRGEWSVAKGAYVRTNSGWFSERSACYLATGRPVVVQDTGFTEWLKSDVGALPFGTLEEAVSQLESVHSNYLRHCLAAREIAETYFDSRRVLSALVSVAFGTSTTGCPS